MVVGWMDGWMVGLVLRLELELIDSRGLVQGSGYSPNTYPTWLDGWLVSWLVGCCC